MSFIEAFDKKFSPKRRRCPRCNSHRFVKELPKFVVKDRVLTGFLPNKLGRHCLDCGLCFKFRANGEIVQIKEVPRNISFGG